MIFSCPISSLLAPAISLILSTKSKHCEDKIEGFFSRNFTFFHYKDLHIWSLWIPSYPLKLDILKECSWIWISAMERVAHIFYLRTFDYTLTIMSNLYHVDSLPWQKKTYKKKLTTNWTINKKTLVQKVSTLFRNLKMIFLVFCLRFKR